MLKMFKKLWLIIPATIISFSITVFAEEEREWDNIYEAPDLPKDTVLFDHEKLFAYRGRIGYYFLPPSKMGCYYDAKVNYLPKEQSSEDSVRHKTGEEFFSETDLLDKEIWHNNESIKVMYNRKEVGKSFSGAYIVFKADLSQYTTMTFMIKGKKGGERFLIGVNDAVSNKREDMVPLGAINAFLPGGVTRDWQMVKIPMSAFYGPDTSRIMTFIFDCNEEHEGTYWIDDLRFYRKALVFPMKNIYDKGYLLLDNFDYSYINLLGRKSNTYKKLPSICKHTLDKDVFYGEDGKSLRLDYDKPSRGWCGYFTLLNQVDGEWFDLSEFDKVSFMVRGAKGGEIFEIGMADKNWVTIGDSLKAGTIDKYLPGGVTTQWQEVTIALSDFGLLDFTEMGSFVINFSKKQKGAIWLDDLKFLLKEESEEEVDW